MWKLKNIVGVIFLALGGRSWTYFLVDGPPHHKGPNIRCLLLNSTIASVTALSLCELNISCLLYRVCVPLNWDIGGPRTGHIVPPSGSVPFSKYALT